MVRQNFPNIIFPIFYEIDTEDWVVSILRQAAEEQVQGLGADMFNRVRCRKGCAADENSYHVISGCICPEYNVRHDFAVFWVIKYILLATKAPDDIKSKLNYGKASIVTEYNWGNRKIKIKAGVKIQTENRLYYNRPDIYIQLSNPDEILVIELSVAHLQNIDLQEKIKKTRYSKNSCIYINKDNYDTVPRDLNIIEHLKNAYKCPTSLGIFVIGALGEICLTPEHQNFKKLMNKVGVKGDYFKNLLKKCSVSVATSSAKLIIQRLKS